MAHVGKLWPLAFRRDYNLNVSTNQRGLANRYLVQLVVASKGPGLVLDQSRWDLPPPFESPVGTLIWKAPVQEFGFGLRYWIEFHVQIQADSTYWNRGQVWSDNFGILVADWNWGPRGTRTPGVINPFGGSMLFWDDQHFFTNPFLDASAIDEKFWSAGPPH